MSDEYKTRFLGSSAYDEADRLSEHVEAVAKTTQQLLSGAEAELASTKAQIAALESLRPLWAQGWTSDSLAAQASAVALAQIWTFLGASNQTEAMQKLRSVQGPFHA